MMLTEREYAQLMDQIDRQVRPGQYALIRSTLLTAYDCGQLVAGAPTATGKSLAALIAGAWLAKNEGVRTIIGTFTRLLQTQYATGEVPIAERLFPGVAFAILKGASNYICAEAAAQSLLAEDIRAPGMKALVRDVADGLIEPGEITPALRTVDRWVAADAEACVDHDPERCGYRAARIAAGQAQVVVTNHMLVVLNRVNPKILGPHRLLIVDEVHNVTAAAESFVRTKVRPDLILVPRAIGHVADNLVRLELETDHNTALRRAAAELVDVRNLLQTLTESATLLSDPLRSHRRPLDEDVYSDPQLDRLAIYAAHELDELGDYFAPMLHRNHWRGLKRWVRAREDDGAAGIVGSIGLGGSVRDPKAALWTAATDVSRILGPALDPVTELGDRGVVMMSATIGTPEHPAYVAERAGVTGAAVMHADSPIDYAASMRVCLVNGENLVRLVDDVDGRTLILCPSWVRVASVYAQLTMCGYVAHVQVEGDPLASRAVLADYAASGGRRQVLIGTRSFFEGIDITGPALSQIIILAPPVPFGSTIAERERRRHLGSEVLNRYLIPETALLFEQQIGRLLRTVDDVGLVAVVNGAQGRDAAQWAGVARPALDAALAALGVPGLTARDEAVTWFHSIDPEDAPR